MNDYNLYCEYYSQYDLPTLDYSIKVLEESLYHEYLTFEGRNPDTLRCLAAAFRIKAEWCVTKSANRTWLGRALSTLKEARARSRMPKWRNKRIFGQ